MDTNKTYLTNLINGSQTISEVSAEAVDDPRGLMFKYDTNGKVVVASTEGEKVIGVAIVTNGVDIAADDDIDLQVKDIGPVMAGGTIAKGADVMVNAAGKAVTATTGKFAIGTALEAAVADQLFMVLIDKHTA